jgi:transposase
LRYWRVQHPDPRIPRRMEALYLRSQGVANGDILRLCSISKASFHRYLHAYVTGGGESWKHLPPQRPRSALHRHRTTIEAAFRQHPPATVAEAAARLEALSGIARRPTQVRQFLTALGRKPRNVGMIPAKADVEAQEAFKKIVWSHGEQKPRLASEPSCSWMPHISCLLLFEGLSGGLNGCSSKHPQVGNG